MQKNSKVPSNSTFLWVHICTVELPELLSCLVSGDVSLTLRGFTAHFQLSVKVTAASLLYKYFCYLHLDLLEFSGNIFVLELFSLDYIALLSHSEVILLIPYINIYFLLLTFQNMAKKTLASDFLVRAQLTRNKEN